MDLNILLDKKRSREYKSREWKVDKGIQAHLNKKNNLKHILEDGIYYTIILDFSIRNSWNNNNFSKFVPTGILLFVFFAVYFNYDTVKRINEKVSDKLVFPYSPWTDTSP